jgi:hypothetical protein
MPPALKLELKNPGSEEWIHISSLHLGDNDGSVSDNHLGGRDVYVFGIDDVENQGYVKKSIIGMDEVTDTVRKLTTAGLVIVAALGMDESYELTVRTDKTPEPRTIKLTYFND